jgi:hypothetical protein
MKQPYRTAAEGQEREGATGPAGHLGLAPLILWAASVLRCFAAWREGDVSSLEPLLAVALAIGLAPAARRAVRRALGRDAGRRAG